MKKVKILSIILSVAMIFSLLTVSVSAEATYAVSAANATVAPGGDVDVAISIEAPSCHGIGFALNYESAALTYKDYTLTASNGVTDAEVSVDTTTTGVVDVTVLSDGKAYTGAFITITFTAKSTIEGTNEETNITTGANMNGFLDDGYLPVDNSNISFGSAKVTIQAAHTAPTVTAVITGSGKVGTELSGEVTEDEGTSKVVDSWSLTPTIAYEWSKVVNEEKVVLGTEATYTPKKEDRNAEITLTITATVTGDGVDDDTATGTGTDTITIVKNDDDNYKPTVTLDTVDEESVAGRDIVISFTYDDKNGIASKTEAAAQLITEVEGEDPQITDIPAEDVVVDNANSTVTISTTNDMVGKKVSVIITAKNNEDDEGNKTDAVEIKVIEPAVPTLTLDKDYSKTVTAGKNIEVKYDAAITDESAELEVTAEAYYYEEGKEPTKDDYINADAITVDAKNSVVKVATTSAMAGKNVKVVITAANVTDGTSVSETTEAIELKKSGGTSGGSTGPSLVPGKNNTNNNNTGEATNNNNEENNNNNEENNNNNEENKPSKSYPKESIILTIGEKEVGVFGETITNDVAPKIVKDRTMLPARLVAENLGATVAWDGEAKTVTITKGAVTIVITIDSDKALVNGEEVALDSPAFIENDRTYTPMRFIAEALNANVEWNDATKAVTITPGK